MNTQQYIGLTKENAIKLAKSNNVQSRITEEDGVGRMVTMDYRKDRVNFSVENNIVTAAKVG